MNLESREDKINVLISDYSKTIEHLDPKEALYQSLNKYEHYFVGLKLLQKIHMLLKNIINESSDLLLNYSTVRYTLESLIQCRLIEKEQDYIYKICYSIYTHQIDKTERFIERLKNEITIISKYENMENEHDNKIKPKEGANQVNDLLEYIENGTAYQHALDNLADDELTIFFGDYKNNGYTFQKYIMENDLMKRHTDNLENFIQLRNKKAKEILKKDYITSLFDFRNQYTRVFKQLKDDRSWKEKAVETNLSEEYKLMYEISSAILHSTSYSIVTSTEPSEQEVYLALDLIYKYSALTIKTIKRILEFDKWQNLKVYNINDL